MKTILFVCTANIARSPMAAALCNHLMAQKDLADQYRSESAGTWGHDGLPAAVEGVRVMAEFGLDISQHRSRVVTWDIIMQSDLILTMEGGHAEALRFEFRQKSHQVYMLTQVIGPPYDIDDPFGHGLSRFRGTAQEIAEILERGCDRIIALAEGSA
jgi:protein-tyrosine-phosphatase